MDWFSNQLQRLYLTHWGRVTYICVSKLTIIASDNGLSPGRRQAIIWTNDGILLIWPLGTNFSEISIGIQTFSFKKMHLKISSAKWRPFCLGLNVLKTWCHDSSSSNSCQGEMLHCSDTNMESNKRWKSSNMELVFNQYHTKCKSRLSSF